jgi:hypothetical protein
VKNRAGNFGRGFCTVGNRSRSSGGVSAEWVLKVRDILGAGLQLRQVLEQQNIGGGQTNGDVDQATYMEIRDAASAAFAEFMQQVGFHSPL